MIQETPPGKAFITPDGLFSVISYRFHAAAMATGVAEGMAGGMAGGDLEVEVAHEDHLHQRQQAHNQVDGRRHVIAQGRGLLSAPEGHILAAPVADTQTCTTCHLLLVALHRKCYQPFTLLTLLTCALRSGTACIAKTASGCWW